jgi:flagellar secretion chaperone FliS
MEFLTEEAVYQKTPQQLTALLYESLIDSIESAIGYTEQKEYAEANKQLQKANDILHRLGVGLKYDAGIIAHQLDALYNYMAEQLIEANIKKDVTIMQTVLKIATEISSAWNEAMKKSSSAPSASRMNKVSTYEQFIATYEQS